MFILKLVGKILLLPVWLVRFCDRPGSEDDSTDLCGCKGNPWFYIHFVDYSDCILLP